MMTPQHLTKSTMKMFALLSMLVLISGTAGQAYASQGIKSVFNEKFQQTEKSSPMKTATSHINHVVKYFSNLMKTNEKALMPHDSFVLLHLHTHIKALTH